MTSPPSQPTVADAVRLMDSLNTGTGHSPPTESLPDRGLSNRSVTLPRLGNCSSHDSSANKNVAFDAPNASGLYGGALDGHKEPACQAAWTLYLPAEIILQIAMHLLPSISHHCLGSYYQSTSFPCEHASPPYTGLNLDRAGSALSSLLSLSAASRAFRNTLLPLVWHTIVIRTPQHLPRLAALLKSYDTLSLRSHSPPSSSTGRRDPSPRHSNQGSREGAGVRHPLPHIRSIIVSIPDKYSELDQAFLLTLLRSMHLTETRQLEHLSWSAEAVPNPAIWALVGPSLRSLEVDGRTFYQGHRGWGALERLQSLKMVGYESTLLPSGVVAVFQAQRALSNGSEEHDGCQALREVPEELLEAVQRGRPVESPLIELQRSTATSPRRQAQHLYLDPPPCMRETTMSTSPTAYPSSVSGRSRRVALQHLSLSSSKTSLLHQRPLILAGAFAGLTCLDIYAVTPEPPLASALLTCSTTLTHLRLVLDISGAFAHFDSLWSTLTANLPALVSLQLDPMPHPSTAPSFTCFVQQCPSLRWINGRSVASFAPSFASGDPSHPSTALPF